MDDICPQLQSKKRGERGLERAETPYGLFSSSLSPLWLTGSHHNPAGSSPNSLRISLSYRLMHTCGFGQHQCQYPRPFVVKVIYSHTNHDMLFLVRFSSLTAVVMNKSPEELLGSFASQYFIGMCNWPHMAIGQSHPLQDRTKGNGQGIFPFSLDHMALEQM